jgi:polar amino acid transport system substrate-binding protein
MKTWHRFALVMCAFPIIAHSDTYTCVSFEYPPLISQGTNGNAEGLAVAVVSQVFRRMGHDVQVVLYPWGRALALARQGDADCIFTLYRSAEREQFLDYSQEAVIPQIIYLYARKGVTLSFDGDLASLKGFHVGTAHKVHYGPKFEEARPRLVIDEAPTIEQNFRKLALGRVDVVPSNLYTASATLALPSLQPYADRIIRLPVPVETVMSYIAFPKAKKMTALRDSFDAGLRAFMGSGEYRRLLENYRLESTPELAKLIPSR